MPKPDSRIVNAARLQQARNFPAAEQIFRKILKSEPSHADARFLLGLLLYQTARHELALEQLGVAIELRPTEPDFHQTRLDTLFALGRMTEAIAEAQVLVRLQPNTTRYQQTLSQLLLQNGDARSALAHARRAVEIPPPSANAYRILASVLGKLDQPIEALAALDKACALSPNSIEVLIDRGYLLQTLGRLSEAIDAYNTVLKLAPQNEIALNNLGACYVLSARPEEALRCFQTAVQLNPSAPESRSNIGAALLELGRIDEAISVLEETSRLHPQYADASNNLGSCYARIGEHEKAIAAFRQALAVRPSFAGCHSNLLMSLLYSPGSDEKLVYAEHLAWNRAQAEPVKNEIQPPQNDFRGDRPLRIGYVSADFREHSVRYFIEPILSAHDRRQCEIFCYATGARRDEVTDRLRNYATAWHDVAGATDVAIADLIRSHRIDILVDLAGHTSDNRLLTFARKPAPVQVTYLGYPATTGMETMDYRLTDSIADPETSAQEFYREELRRLPGAFFVYGDDQSVPLAPGLPADANGFVTFGSFNNMAKISDDVLSAWASILTATPNSNLLINTRAMGNAGTRERVLEFFSTRGIAMSRLAMWPWMPLAQYMNLLRSVDITLDTFPFNGHTTSCKSLWMGAPFITLTGNHFRGRMGTTILHHLDLKELIATSQQDYIERAVTLANDRTRLRELWRTMRERMLSSPLTDAATFTAGLEAIYRRMWERACRRTVPTKD